MSLPNREKFPALLKKLRLEHGAVRVEGTPRRLAVLVSDLVPRQPDVEEAVKGPPAKVGQGFLPSSSQLAIFLDGFGSWML